MAILAILKANFLSIASQIFQPVAAILGRPRSGMGPKASGNRIEATKLILNIRILRGCTPFVLGNPSPPFDYHDSRMPIGNMTILSLISSVYISMKYMDSYGLQFTK